MNISSTDESSQTLEMSKNERVSKCLSFECHVSNIFLINPVILVLEPNSVLGFTGTCLYNLYLAHTLHFWKHNLVLSILQFLGFLYTFHT